MSTWSNEASQSSLKKRDINCWVFHMHMLGTPTEFSWFNLSLIKICPLYTFTAQRETQGAAGMIRTYDRHSQYLAHVSPSHCTVATRDITKPALPLSYWAQMGLRIFLNLTPQAATPSGSDSAHERHSCIVLSLLVAVRPEAPIWCPVINPRPTGADLGRQGIRLQILHFNQGSFLFEENCSPQVHTGPVYSGFCLFFFFNQSYCVFWIIFSILILPFS